VTLFFVGSGNFTAVVGEGSAYTSREVGRDFGGNTVASSSLSVGRALVNSQDTD